MARKVKGGPAPSATRKRVDVLSEIGSRFDLWRPAADVLVPVRGVRTRFIWLDAVTKIGAWPIERVCTLHGPSNEGKTTLAMGLGASFLDVGGFYAHVDAELTTSITWIGEMMSEHVKNKNFLALRPQTYEDTVAAARQFCNGLGELKAKGTIPPETPGIMVVDSIRKLNPKKLLDELMKAQKADDDDKPKGRWGKKPKGVDGAGGRAAQIKAALNAQWLDELVPLAAKAGASIVLIARESNEDEDDPFARDVKVTGGRALIFDASLVVRCTRSAAIHKGGEGKDVRLIGEKHAVEIRKTKIGGKHVMWPKAFFHTTTGAVGSMPTGFDPARDALELGKSMGVVKVAGTSHFSWEGTQLGNGADNAVETLVAEPALLRLLQDDIRSRFELEGQAMREAMVPVPALAVVEKKRGTRRVKEA